MFVKQIGCILASAAAIAPFAATPAHAGTATLNVNVTGCDTLTFNGATGSQLNFSCSSASTANTPTGCAPTINGGTSSVPLPNTGGTVNLNVQGCSTTGLGPITYQWVRNGANLASLQSTTDTIGSNSAASPTTTSYQVRACNNGAECALFPQSPLTAVTAAATGGGGGGGAGGGAGTIPNCEGYTSTLKMTFNYVAGSGQVIQTSQGMSPTDILVATFKTPALSAGATSVGGSVVINDNAQNSNGFVGSLSTTPCGFTSNIKSGLLSAQWNPNLKPNTQYYLNIKGDSALSVKLFLN